MIKGKIFRYILPMFLFTAFVILLAKGLANDPRLLPSAKINHEIPTFNIPVINFDNSSKTNQNFTRESMLGKVWVLNFFASWCGACIQETASLIKLSKNKKLEVIGFAYKDDPNDTQMWLEKYGNPFTIVASDIRGNVGIDFGVYGVPETYVIDQFGVIRYRHVGIIDEEFYLNHILPVLNNKRNSEKLIDTLGESNQRISKENISDEKAKNRMQLLASELRCLVCQNQSLADSNAALAIDLKDQIFLQIKSGRTDEQIKQYMTQRYGEFILYNPPFNIKNSLLWMLPFIFLLILIILFKRLYSKESELIKHKVPNEKMLNLESAYLNSKQEIP